MHTTKVDKRLRQAATVLKDELFAERIFLFGSRASGKAGPNSDYDFVVVTGEKRRPRPERIRKAKALLRELGVTADIFVYTEKLFHEWEDEFSSIPETAKNTGIELSL